FSRCEVFCTIDPLRIFNTHLVNAFFELRCVYDKSREDLAIQAAHRGCCDYAFWRATYSHHGVDPGTQHRRGDACRQIAITDEANACAGGTDVIHQFLVPWTIENDDDQVLNTSAE